MAEEKNTSTPEMTPKEMSFLLKTIWEALLAPTWKKDDLITLGKLLFAKQKLKDIDEKIFMKEVLPNLKVVAASLHATLTQEAIRQSKEVETEVAAADAPKKTEDEKGEAETKAEDGK